MKFSIAAVSLAAAVFAHQVIAGPLPFNPATYQRRQEGPGVVGAPCTEDNDCQQGCCGFTTGTCDAPVAAQTNGDGGCGFGGSVPNCNVAAALGFSDDCAPGATSANLDDPSVGAAVNFVISIDGDV